MLLTNIDVVGRKEETEQIVIYGREFPITKNHKIERITLPVHVDNPLTGNIRELKPCAISRKMTLNNVSTILEDIKLDSKLAGITYERPRITEKNNTTHYIIYAEGKCVFLNNLPEVFTVGPKTEGYSTKDMLKQLSGMPFMLYKNNKGILCPERLLTREEFCALPTHIFDSEFMFWEDKITLNDLGATPEQLRIFLNAQRTPQDSSDNYDGKTKKELVALIEEHFNTRLRTTPEYSPKPSATQFAREGKECIEVDYFTHLGGTNKDIYCDTPVGKALIHIHRSANVPELMQSTNSHIEDAQDMIKITQNGMMYDDLKLREHGLLINKKKPIIDSHAGFFPRVISRGMFHIDMAGYSQQYYPFTIDNKLATIAQLHTNKPVRKTQSYDDQTRNTIEMLVGNEDAFWNELEYGVTDVALYTPVAKHIKPLVYLKCRLFNQPPENICMTSKKTLALNTFKTQGLFKNKEYPQWRKKDAENFADLVGHDVFLDCVADVVNSGNSSINNVHEEDRTYSFKNEWTDLLKDPLIKEGVKKNTVKEYHVAAQLYYLAPFTRIYHKLLKSRPEAKAILEYSQQPDTRTLEKLDIINTLENGYLLPYIYLASKERFKGISTGEIIDEYLQLIDAFPFINHSENFYCFSKEQCDNPEFARMIKGLGFKVASGNLLNVKKGSFILYDGLNIYKRGIDVKGDRGFKTLYETELIHDFVEQLCSAGPVAAMRVAEQCIDQITSKSLDINKLVFFNKKITKDYYDYSLPAQRQERIKAYIDFAKKKGDRLAYIKFSNDGERIPLEEISKIPSDQWYSDEHVAFLYERLFGETHKYGRALAEGILGKYLAPLAPLYGMKPSQLGIALTTGKFNNDPISEQLELF